MAVKIHDNLVTGCHDCPFNNDFHKCSLGSKGFHDSIINEQVAFDCPMLKEETHSITIMLSDQYNKDETNRTNSRT